MVTKDKTSPTAIARYRPSHDSATQPVTGSNIQRAICTYSNAILRLSGRLRAIAGNTSQCAKYRRPLMNNTKVVPREKKQQYLAIAVTRMI